jgi:hypothetical protein
VIWFFEVSPLLTAIFINDCAIFMIDEIIRHGIFDVRNCRYEVAGICVSSVSAGLEGKYWREADESKEEKTGSMEICGRGDAGLSGGSKNGDGSAHMECGGGVI